MYGISVDSPWCHDAWHRQLDLPEDIVLLSDFNRQFGQAYGLLHTSASGWKDILRRCVLIVDPSGRITYRWDAPDPPRLPTAQETLDALRGGGGTDIPSSATTPG